MDEYEIDEIMATILLLPELSTSYLSQLNVEKLISIHELGIRRQAEDAMKVGPRPIKAWFALYKFAPSGSELKAFMRDQVADAIGSFDQRKEIYQDKNAGPKLKHLLFKKMLGDATTCKENEFLFRDQIIFKALEKEDFYIDICNNYKATALRQMRDIIKGLN